MSRFLIAAVFPIILLFGPVAIVLIILAILLLLALLALIIWLATRKTTPDDPLAHAPGHDHSAGAANCPACQASAEAAKAQVPQKVNILFRPDSSWAGEYGFDWMREHDTGMPGDVAYKGNIGSYGAVYATEAAAVFTASDPNYQSLKGTYYNPYNSPWKKQADNTTPYEYLTPCINLFPADQCVGNNKKCEANLRLKIEVVGNEPDVLRVVYDKTFFTVDKETITPKTVGTYESSLKIKCIKEFPSDQEIKIVPHKTTENHLAGKIMIQRNDKNNRYKANVVFVNVTTKITGVVNTGNPGTDQAFLEKYMFQSLTSLNIVQKTLDLKSDAHFNSTFVMNSPAGKAIRNTLTDGTPVHATLENKFNKKEPTLANYYKVFIFDEIGGLKNGPNFLRLNGAARDINSKSVAVYRGRADATMTHELMHAMGLWHTFDNHSTYVYKIGQTDNIMDYSHQTVYGSKARISTWRWQWERLRAGLDPE